ncbi:MAG TPA: hypothetical protein VFQ61_33180 [Polyangiaceae bacterium]|nr:hypothetical protein [Polyangiaceae bacterium]
MAERIKVLLKRVFVKNDADWFGSGEFYFTCDVDGRRVGNREQIFTARTREWIVLPAAAWSAVVDVTNKAQVVVHFNGKDDDLFWDDDLGTVAYTLRPPWAERSFRSETEFFILEWGVELEVDGAFGHHPPNEVFACRSAAGNATCTTVSGVPITARIEIHPVRPVPASLPPRGLPAGPVLGVLNDQGTTISPGDPINIVPNPSVIPILTAPGGAAPAAGAPPVADATNCARIEVTFYRPNTLAFTDQDPRLVWSFRALAGGAVSFLGAPHGLKVMVYGTAAGEVLLELRFRGELMAAYRALVMPVKQIPCRCNILNGPNASSRPRATPANVEDHLKIANRYLRQIALELVLDTNAHRSHGATATGTPGIFRIAVSKGTTWHINSDLTAVPATGLNYRPNVMNFAYIHSERRPSIGGAATDFPSSTVAPPGPGARPRITDTGTPSSSWIRPSGVLPDGAAAAVSMDLINGIQRPGHPRLFAMFLCDNIGDPAVLADQQLYAKSMCHELGHILNLGHRVEGPDATTATGLVANGMFWDGLSHPPNQNVMFWQGVQDICQDFDIVQARAVHRSPLVPP